jgi:hypothetical protein
VDENEQYVRERWTGVSADCFPLGWFVHANWGADAEVICIAGFNCATEAEAWSAAKAFTEDRERQIADYQDALTWVEHIVGKLGTMPQRILISKMLEAKLAELRQGMVAK